MMNIRPPNPGQLRADHAVPAGQPYCAESPAVGCGGGAGRAESRLSACNGWLWLMRRPRGCPSATVETNWRMRSSAWACTAEVTTEQVYLALIAPLENSGDHSDDLSRSGQSFRASGGGQGSRPDRDPVRDARAVLTAGDRR
jgi:hypothetical protein